MLALSYALKGAAMKKAAIRSRLALVFLVTLIVLATGCGRGNETKSAAPTSNAALESTEAGPPTWTPAPFLPDTSVVTLQPAAAPTPGAYLPDGLYVANASTGDILRVETQPGPLLSPRAWVSPTQLVTSASTQSDHSLYLLDLSAKTLRRLPASSEIMGVSFSHSHGLMTNMSPGGELMIWSFLDSQEVARIDTPPVAYVLWAPDDKHIYWPGAPGRIASVGPAPRVVAVDVADPAYTATWSSDGSAIVFANAQGIFSVNADSGEKTLLYSWPPGSGVDPSVLRLSADGKYALAAGRGMADGFRALVVPLAGGTEGIQITGVEAETAQWSPTEDVAAVIADWCKPEARLLLVNADGSIRSTIVSQPDLQIPRFSADGSLVAYVGRGPQEKGLQDQRGITVRKAQGGDNLVSFIAGFFWTGWWSPDGRWFAYSPSLPAYQCVSDLEKTQILPFP